MKILIDSNILILAVYNPRGTPYKAFLKAVAYPNKGIICEQNVKEVHRIFRRKFPDKLYSLERFLLSALMAMELVDMPETEIDDEQMIRDPSDRPILRAAVKAHADILLTGDKDFLEANITNLKVMTASDFLNSNI
ncbi:MAG: putative toxin-antitoxin system toxin component, PIN family [Bacillus sp. (in: Bacteria)]|nr:putative toxin-antitoxin system toxin component, PIN family [Bacillus sp. (in: firmicutes)]MCM1426320.1 putative toxin-antitoxin system toxin component, PIN family [Eubacterium sp.]